MPRCVRAASGVGPQLSQLDRASSTLVRACGALLAAVFLLGCAHGWWWSGELKRLPVVGAWLTGLLESARLMGWAVAASLAGAGAWAVYWLWCAGVDAARGARLRSGARRTGGGGA